MTRTNPLFLALLEAHKKREAASRVPPRESVYDFIARVSPELVAPRHLDPIVSIIESAQAEPFEAVTATPPRHAKTTTILHDCVLLLERDPTFKIAYVTYATELAETKSLDARRLAERSVDAWKKRGFRPPMELDPGRQNLREWRTTKGGMFVATGIGGGLTGMGFNLVIVDDPFKGRTEAESPLIRMRTADWFDSVAYTRREPKGTSFLINATRWHPDDLSGRMIARGWRSVNLKALDDERGALWPEMFGEEQLRKIQQNNPYEFAALYQGEPRARGSTVFGEPHFYESLPNDPHVTVVGLDFAYTANTYSDFSVAVVLRIYSGLGKGGGPRAYVVDVLRVRADAPTFKARLKRFLDRHVAGGTIPQCRAFVSGTETAAVDFMARGGDGIGEVWIQKMQARGDKFTRAQDCAAAWNRGDLVVPKTDGIDEWLEPFLGELSRFTGVRDDHDDQVDALAGAFTKALEMVGGDELDDNDWDTGDSRWGGAGRGF